MIPYASRTGTARNLAALRAAGWGLMLSATGVHRTEGFERYAIDNGAWTAHQQGTEWDERRFLALVELHGPGAQFIVAPDIVGGGWRSFALSYSWLPRLEAWPGSRVLVPVQDGLEAHEDDVREVLGPRVGLFLGGTTEWKLRTMRSWGELARGAGAYFHVGRVNTARRIRLCAAAGADSFDGSGVSKYTAEKLPRLELARRQTTWRW